MRKFDSILKELKNVNLQIAELKEGIDKIFDKLVTIENQTDNGITYHTEET